jgi:hypothetical protein
MSAYISGLSILMKNLRGLYKKGDGFYLPPDKVLEILKGISGQDFGDDIDMWTKFFNGELDDNYYTEIRRKYGSKIRPKDDSEA